MEKVRFSGYVVWEIGGNPTEFQQLVIEDCKIIKKDFAQYPVLVEELGCEGVVFVQGNPSQQRIIDYLRSYLEPDLAYPG